MLAMVDLSTLTTEALVRAAVILCVGLLLIFSAIISITITLCNDALRDVIGYYMISLSAADLLCSVAIIPASMYSALAPEWQFMGDNSLVCKCSVYLEVVLFASTAYTLAWIGIDRYVALMRPQRYEAEQTITRCKCWIVFTWSSTVLFALPIVVARMKVSYYHAAELCLLDWSATTAYNITLASIILVPSTCSILFTYCSIFWAIRNPYTLEDSQRLLLETDHNFALSFFVLIAFILSWLPIIAVRFVPQSLLSPADLSTVDFVFAWLAIGGSSSKLLISLFINQEFRATLGHCISAICPCCCCLTPSTAHQKRRLEYRSLSDRRIHSS
ncbi:7 transmembrane receptor [Onchocerca flexuosa]|uniref:7 transmembrane receptor n=1 Tax=Onchocerca flexuosa TaxID=387005 RepID=A0A238BYI5_9BILA|nr:7 transmembrane receptor [Onchocerca flexuosa]